MWGDNSKKDSNKINNWKQIDSRWNKNRKRDYYPQIFTEVTTRECGLERGIRPERERNEWSGIQTIVCTEFSKRCWMAFFTQPEIIQAIPRKI